MSAEILIAEDSATFRTVLSAILKKEGYKLAEAASGKETIKMAANDNDLQLFILDFRLKDMTAFEILYEMKQKNIHQKTPVMIISGSSAKDYEAKIKEYGVLCWFIKPCNLKDVKTQIKRIVKLYIPMLHPFYETYF